MIVFSHLKLSHVLYKELTSMGYDLDQVAFAYGSIKPDISRMIIDTPHKRHISGEYVAALLRELELGCPETDKTLFSYKLGIACHYLTDFFTYSHDARFEGSPVRHLTYELRVHMRLRKRRIGATAPDQEANLDLLEERLERLYSAYCHAATAPVIDVRYAADVCRCVCLSLLALTTTTAAVSTVI